jgi:malate dehydrogenase
MPAPIRVCITGAAGLISYSLIPQIAMGACFGQDTPVIIHMLDIEPCIQGLKGLEMELEDMCNPCLKGVVATTDPLVAFKDVDYAILCGAFPRKQGMERKDLLAKNAGIFKEQGLAIAKVGKKDMRVLVVGNPANTNAMLLQHFSGLPKMNVHAMTRLDHNRARNMLARKVGGGCQGLTIKNLVIWGNHSPTMYPDVRFATVNGKLLSEVITDREYLEKTFVADVAQRGTTVIKTRGSSSATSAGRGALDHVHDWFLGNAHEWCSCGVYSDGSLYGIPQGVIYSVPCICKGNGEVEIVKDLPIDAFSRNLMDITAKELTEEREMALASIQ